MPYSIYLFMSVVRGCESGLPAILSIRMGQEYKPEALSEERALISVSISLRENRNKDKR